VGHHRNIGIIDIPCLWENIYCDPFTKYTPLYYVSTKFANNPQLFRKHVYILNKKKTTPDNMNQRIHDWHDQPQRQLKQGKRVCTNYYEACNSISPSKKLPPEWCALKTALHNRIGRWLDAKLWVLQTNCFQKGPPRRFRLSFLFSFSFACGRWVILFMAACTSQFCFMMNSLVL
jgi:hypothetical protein